MVNNHTQINHRPLVQRITDPLLNQEEPPKIRDVNKVFMEKGVDLALAAAKKALADWGGSLDDITHLGESPCRRLASSDSSKRSDFYSSPAFQLPGDVDVPWNGTL